MGKKIVYAIEINETNWSRILKRLTTETKVLWAGTRNIQNPSGVRPSDSLQYGFPVGAKYIVSDSKGINYYTRKQDNYELLSESDFVAHCAKRYGK